MEKDNIIVNIYGDKITWNDKLKAIKYYADKITDQNSLSDRMYIDIVLKLASGEKCIIE